MRAPFTGSAAKRRVRIGDGALLQKRRQRLGRGPAMVAPGRAAASTVATAVAGEALEQVVGGHPVGGPAAEVVAVVEQGRDGRGGEQAAGPAGDQAVLVAVGERAHGREEGGGVRGGGGGVRHGGSLRWLKA